MIIFYKFQKVIIQKSNLIIKNAQFVASLKYVKTLVCFDDSKQSKSKETKEKSMKHAISFLQTQCLIKDLTMTRAYSQKITGLL